MNMVLVAASTGAKIGIIVAGLLVGVVIVAVVFVLAAVKNLKELTAKMDAAEKDMDEAMNKQVEVVGHFLDAIKKYDKTSKPEELKRIYPKSKMTMEERRNVLEGVAAATEHVRIMTEAFPEFKKEEEYGKLQIERYNVEEHLQNAVSQYNSYVKSYNRDKAKFPASLAAKSMKLGERPVFDRRVQTADQ